MVILAFAGCTSKSNKNSEVSAYESGKAAIKKLFTKNEEKNKPGEVNPCESMAREILLTSPRYKELTKGLNKRILENGGSSFGINLEGSPLPSREKKQVYSKSYDFTLYEMYPDRQLNTSRFSFNPDNNQLYEYDVVNGQFKVIAFDRNLLTKNKTNCK